MLTISKLDPVNGGAPRIELLWWEGCPSWPKALETLREAAREQGLDPDLIEMREVTSDVEAKRERFVGSPTIRVDGEELQPPQDEPFGLTCRVYRRRDGRPSPTPDPDDLRDLLRKATNERR
jgi:hypothetical protein